MILHEERRERCGYGKQQCEILPAIPLLMGGGMLAGMGGSIFGGIMGAKGAQRQAESAAAWTNSALNNLSSAWTATNEATLPIRQLGEVGASRLLNAPQSGTSLYGYTAPYTDLGASSATTLQNLLMGGNVGQALQNSPMFRWQQAQGERDINRQLAARGLYNSGAGLETLARFNAQLQAQEGENLFSRLFGATQLGQGSAQFAAQLRSAQEQAGLDRMLSLTGLGATAATNQAQFYQNIANAQAQAKLGAGAQIGGARNQQYQSLGQMGQGIGQNIAGFAGGLGNYMLYQPLLQAQTEQLQAQTAQMRPSPSLSQYGPYAGGYRLAG